MKAKHWILVLFLTVVASVTDVFGAGPAKSNNKESDYVPLPVIKLPTSVKSAKWNRLDTSFAYSENRNIFVRDAATLEEKQKIQAERDIRLMNFAEYGSDSNIDQLLAFSEDNVMTVRVLPNPTPSVGLEFKSTTNITAVAFSDDGTYIGLGTDSGQANLYMQLYMTGELSNRMLLGHTGLIYSVAFSHNGKYFATASRDGTIRIWETRTSECLSVLPLRSSSELPICFSPDGTKLIIAKDANTLTVNEFNGQEVRRIECNNGIRDLCTSANENTVIVLNKNNEFEYYNLADGVYTGHIPPWNTTTVTCFDFSHDDKRLLVGHEDGSIYIVDVDKVFVRDGEKARVFEIYNVDTGEKQLYDASKTVELKEDEVVLRKSAHSITLSGGYKLLVSKYYNHGFEAEIDYINDRLIQKFYFGGFISGNFIFPNKDFPWVYMVSNTRLTNPNLAGLDVALLVGKEWPIKQTDFSVFAEANVGGGFRVLKSEALGTSKPNASINAGTKIGARWNQIGIYVKAGYDSVYSFNIGVGLTLKIRVYPPIKKEIAEKLEKESGENEK